VLLFNLGPWSCNTGVKAYRITVIRCFGAGGNPSGITVSSDVDFHLRARVITRVPFSTPVITLLQPRNNSVITTTEYSVITTRIA